MKSYRYGSQMHEISELMAHVVHAETEIEMPILNNKFGEPISRMMISTLIRRVQKDNYPDKTFYTYTSRDKKLILGVRK